MERGFNRFNIKMIT